MDIEKWIDDNVRELYAYRRPDCGPIVWAVPDTALRALLKTHAVVPRRLEGVQIVPVGIELSNPRPDGETVAGYVHRIHAAMIAASEVGNE